MWMEAGGGDGGVGRWAARATHDAGAWIKIKNNSAKIKARKYLGV